MLPVAKQVSDFLKDPNSFVEYERPPQFVDIEKDPDGSIKREMIKTFALASIIYEDDLGESSRLPFEHSPEDLDLLLGQEQEL